MKSSSLHLVARHGIEQPQVYRDTLINEWKVPQEMAKRLEVFLLRRLENWMLFRMINDGEIRVGNKSFSVVWVDSPDKLRRDTNIDVLVSLRYCPLLKCGYALIKELKGDIECEYLSTPETEALEKEEQK